MKEIMCLESLMDLDIKIYRENFSYNVLPCLEVNIQNFLF